MTGTVVDLFAGPGGWSEGLRMLGLEDVGVELEPDACRTRANAGHLTIRADVAQYPPEVFRGAWGLIASPPCPDWSTAGGGGRLNGASGHLVNTVPRWVEAVQPTWLVCEQVPPALEVWRHHAATYRAAGYSVWCGVLNAADYGVPQTRERAILVATRLALAAPPEPTHAACPTPGLFGAPLLPWATMADTLGWSGFMDRRQTVAPPVPTSQPAPTLTAMAGAKGVWLRPDGHTLELDDCLAIQGFPPSYPVAGNRYSQMEQVGNAVPPLMAAHIVSAATGVPLNLERAA